MACARCGSSEGQCGEVASVTFNVSGIEFQITESQFSRYHALMQGASAVDNTYLHRLSPSDISLNYMRIPRSISQVLGLGVNGNALLSVHGGLVSEDEYSICADGRRRFTSGWDSFTSSNNLKAGQLVLIFFKKNRAQPVNIVFHLL